MIRYSITTLTVALLASTATAQDTAFVDVTETHVPAAPRLHALDAVFGDFDGDGDLDVAVAVEYGVNRLYLNDGGGRLRWVEGAFGNVAHDNEHVRAADFDGDGLLDLVFVVEDGAHHQLYLGRPDGQFEDASDRLPATSEGNALAIGDVNGDGWPDIVIGNSAEGGGTARNFLWINNPARPGHFIDASDDLPTPVDDEAQGIALADLDGDGDLDMVIANQTPANRLLLNDSHGRFTDASDRLNLSVPTETREVHVFDANGDDLPDIVFFNITSNNRGWDKDPQTRLLIQLPNGRFQDETSERPPQHRFSSWGGQVIDFDGDGALDLVVGAIEVPGFVPMQLRAWRNDGEGRFTDVTSTAMPATVVGRSWSMATGDLDKDGHDDLFVGQWGTQARLLLTDKAAEEVTQGR
ncbi:MAG: VCBS repeat-containing protein [Paracoccus sp. (in: a-proteobacteria)]|uniref:FG-GAP repeat domain-containing protein n=1 Tax=Paracoccus sp. TaxID=267 RepID=UPI0026DF2C61|nr:VCBS repeat-containing protein [Paracoccus sp. (in: a-proteobacteria)]MDO5632775.1 VCBS repeat-containing protein [Paracoccus sp. (in: a-proteobacteria)]